jgi:hypothetical protein
VNIPDKIKIGAHAIGVKFIHPSDIDDFGEFNNYFNQIRLRKDPDTIYPEDNQAEAFLHEIIETINVKNNLQVNHTALTVISEFLFQVIRDNDLDFRK